MTVFEVVCRDCGLPYVPTPEAIRAGVWRSCPSCRGKAAGSESDGDGDADA